MKPRSRFLLTCALAAAYGGVALLGQGLHVLSAGHGPHEGVNVVECETHAAHGGHDCVIDHHRFAAGPEGAADRAGGLQFRSGDCVTDAHACSVCEFLAQARSAPPAIIPAVARPHVAAAFTPVVSRVSAAVSLGPQAPRAPPRAAI